MDLNPRSVAYFLMLYLVLVLCALVVAGSDYQWLSFTIYDNNIKSLTYRETTSVNLGLFRGAACNAATDTCSEGQLESVCFSISEVMAATFWFAFSLTIIEFGIVAGIFYQWESVLENRGPCTCAALTANIVSAILLVYGLAMYSGQAQDLCCQKSDSLSTVGSCGFGISYYFSCLASALLVIGIAPFYFIWEESFADDPAVAEAEEELAVYKDDLKSHKAEILDMFVDKGLSIHEADEKVQAKLQKAVQKVADAKARAKKAKQGLPE